MDIKIEKGIALPSRGRSGKWKSILLKMDVGDSFLIPDDKTCEAVRGAAKVLNCKVALRKIEGMVRMWLLSNPQKIL